MASFSGDRNRRILPRWKQAAELSNSIELEAGAEAGHVERALDFASEKLERLQRAWQVTPSIGLAAELLALAVVHRKPEVAMEAAEWVARQEEWRGSLVADVSRAISKSQETSESEVLDASSAASLEPRKEIRRLRSLLQMSSSDSLAWLDLARWYAVAGESTKAERASRTAVSMAPENRLILRGASRALVHVGSADIAHQVLRRSRRMTVDPWIAAAEIAVSSVLDRQPMSLKSARALLSDTSWRQVDRSELAAAVGSLEAQVGNAKSARRLFEQSLIVPTENAIAQAEWASRELKVSTPDLEFDRLSNAAEAKAWHLTQAGDIAGALKATREWFAQEPFSTRPVSLGGLLAGVASDNHAMAIQLLSAGSRSNPRDEGLRLSLAFNLASIGQVEAAEAQLSRVHVGGLLPMGKVAFLANVGLIQFRRKNPELGRSFYQRAFEQASELKSHHDLSAIVLQYWAHEELVAGASLNSDTVVQAIASARVSNGLDLAVASARLQRRIASVVDVRSGTTQ